MTGIIYTKQARKSVKGVVFAPGREELRSGSYSIWQLCENYDGSAKGGIAKTWRYIAKDLGLDEAKALFEKKLGRKIY
jgi:hypothetical protein